MFEFLTSLTSDFDSDQRFVLCIIAIGCLTGLAIVIGSVFAGTYAAVKKREADLELTRDLLDQGKTAEEIEQILRPADGFSRAVGRWTGGKR